MKRKRYICLLVLLIFYGIRLVVVNAGNEKTDIHMLNDNEKARTKNLEISISDEVLYDTPAFLAKYGRTEDYFRQFAQIFQSQNKIETFLDNEYIICAKMTIRNCSDKTQEIDHLGYHIYIGEGYSNSMNPSLFETLNQFSGLSIRAGHSYSFLVVYDINKRTMEKSRYENLTD